MLIVELLLIASNHKQQTSNRYNEYSKITLGG